MGRGLRGLWGLEVTLDAAIERASALGFVSAYFSAFPAQSQRHLGR